VDAYIPRTHTHTHHTIPLDSCFISRDSTIQLVSLCIHRDVPTTLLGSLCVHRPSQGYTHNPTVVSLCARRVVPTTPLGSLCVHRPSQGYTHNPTGLPVRSQGYTYTPMRIPVPSQGSPHSRPHPKPLLNPYSSQFPSRPSNLSVFFTSLFSVFCLRHILSPTFIRPVPSLIMSLSDSVWSSPPHRTSSYQRSSAHSSQPLRLFISVSQIHPRPGIYFSDSFP